MNRKEKKAAKLAKKARENRAVAKEYQKSIDGWSECFPDEYHRYFGKGTREAI